jgi:hypothetical protein
MRHPVKIQPEQKQQTLISKLSLDNSAASSLKISDPNDAQEVEADKVADKVMMMPEHPQVERTRYSLSQLMMQRELNETDNELKMQPEDKEASEIKMKSEFHENGTAGNPEDSNNTDDGETKTGKIQLSAIGNTKDNSVSDEIQSKLASSAGGGTPLDEPIRREMGTKIGTDFNNVRVHNDSGANEMSSQLGAKAFTYGNDIYFKSGQYNPGSSQGKHLIAHELTHVIQQTKTNSSPDQVNTKISQGGTLADKVSNSNTREIQRDDEVPIKTDLGSEFVLYEWPDAGQGLLLFNGRRWMAFQFMGGLGRRLNVKINVVKSTRTINISIKAGFRVTAHYDTTIEQSITNIAGKSVHFNYVFDFNGSLIQYNTAGRGDTFPTPASIEVEKNPGKLTESDHFPSPSYEGELITHIAPTEPPFKKSPRVYAQSSQQEFDQFAASHPNTKWACVVTEDGQYLAYALTRGVIRNMADRIRKGDYEFDFTRDLNSVKVSRVFINGQPLDSLEELTNMYFTDVDSAAMGLGSTHGLGQETFECLVYQMEGEMYGRMELSHEQATELWDRLDEQNPDNLDDFEASPGKNFAALHVRGRRQIHLLDTSYFRNRQSFYNIITESEGQDQEIVFAHDTKEYKFMLVEADRDQPSERFASTLKKHEPMAERLMEDIYRKVEATAQRSSINAIRDAAIKVRRLGESDEAMRNFVLNFHRLNDEQQDQALGMIGIIRPKTQFLLFMVTPTFQGMYDELKLTLGTLSGAKEFLEGISFSGYDFEYLQAMAISSAEGLEDVLSKLESGEITALKVEGPIGVEARRMAYERWGFTTLRPEDYPHDNLDSDYLPGPMDNATSDFGSIAEQLFFNKVANTDDRETLTQVGVIVGTIAATVILILVANAAGAAVAGLLFAEGSTAFIVTETIVAGITFTALNEGWEQLQGRGSFSSDDLRGSAARLGIQSVVNILTFGAFRGLNAAFGALGRTLVGGSEAAAQSTARGIAAGGIRIGGIMGTAYMAALVHHRVINGEWPGFGEMMHMAAETALTIALLEVGGRMSRPFMQEIGLWSRAKRLGDMSERVFSLEDRIISLQKRIFKIVDNPTFDQTTTNTLVSEQKLLLQEQISLAEDLKSSFRTRLSGDDLRIAEGEVAAEIARINDQLRFLEEAQFIRDTNIVAANEAGDQLYYQPGSEQQVVDFYESRGANVEGPNADGRIRIVDNGRPIEFRPEPPDFVQVGGTRGREVYPVSSTPNLTTISDIFKLIVNAKHRIIPELAHRLHGSELSYGGRPKSYYDFRVPVEGLADPVDVRVEIKARGYDTRGNRRPGTELPSPHGPEAGQATYKLRWIPANNGQPGRWTASIEVDPRLIIEPGVAGQTRSRSEGLTRSLGHELDEIARIVRRSHRLTGEMGDDADLTQITETIASQSRANFFQEGSTARVSQMTDHDVASAHQLYEQYKHSSQEFRNHESGHRVEGERETFYRLLKSMGLQSTSSVDRMFKFTRGLREAGIRDEAFLRRIDTEWRLIRFQESVDSTSTLQLLPGGHRAIDAKLVEHVLHPHQNKSGVFAERGIGGGHERSNLEWLNYDPDSPDVVVREGEGNFLAVGRVFRYGQYRFRNVPGYTKDSAPQPLPDGTYNPDFWIRCNNPKSAVDNFDAFLIHAESAFAQYYRDNIAGQVLTPTPPNGMPFRVIFDGVTYEGFYEYNGADVSSLRLRTIYIDANSF